MSFFCLPFFMFELTKFLLFSDQDTVIIFNVRWGKYYIWYECGALVPGSSTGNSSTGRNPGRIKKKKEKKLKIKIKLILHFFHKKPPNQVFSYLPFPCNTPKHPLTALPPPTVCPHPVSKLGHASQPTAHTFLSSSSFWTLIHLWSDSVRLALRGIQDFCTYRAVASRSGGARLQTGEWKVVRIRES